MQEAPLDSPSVLKVLVIGPDSLSGELAATVLGRPDVDRVHVAAAAETLDVAERLRPHMVVIDLPPSEAGVLAGQLRENDATRPTAIVVLSRSARPDAETELRKAGVNVVVPVPIDPFLWDRRLEELLSVPARRGHRIPVRLRDWSRFVSDADEDEGTVINIGARGVLLETARQLELGTKVGLSFNLPDDPVPVALVGQVVRMAGEERGLVRVGVEFLVYRADARERIAAFVEAEPRPERPGAPSLALTVRSFGEAREWEDELRASEIRKALILDSALDCILTADHEGRIIEFNAAARRLFGYSRSEVLGREVADTIVPPGLRDEMRRRLREFVVSGDSPDLGRRREATAMRSDGTLVPVEVVVVPAYVKGRVILSAYIRDLSERRRSERLAVARQRAAQALTASLSLVEAAPTVLDALVHGLQCNEARLWVVDLDSRAPSLAGTSSGAPHPEASGARDVLARQCLEEGIAVWEGPPAMGTGVGLAVPVRAGGSVLGVLEVRCEKAREREIDWVTALADVASLLALFLKRQRAEADLQRFARYDSLTGLPNRSFFLDTLERTLSRAGRQRTRSALLFLDLDGFKAVNDGLGHAAGDSVLQTMAERLRAGTRSSDLVARIGGDEFIVLVSNLARADDAALAARGLLDRLAKPCRTDNHDVTLSASAGISVYPEDGTDADTLLRNADLAMYRAKQEGKNTYRFFTAAMSESASERMQLQASLRQALEAEEFELHYQPVVHQGAPPSLEALVRWRRPGMGLLAPGEFIGAAEESGLVVPLGRWVLRAATRFASGLPRSDVRVAVNLSARQFLQADLVETVEEALRESGLPADRLEIEVTESVVMSDAEEVKARLDRLRALGLQLTLDDFGSGYSSLSYLKKFRFHRIKIDRTFVRDLPGDADSAAIVDAVLAMAKSLGLEVIAEGVETEEQRNILHLLRCDMGQGFYFSPAVSAAEFEKLLR
jgi:diguanylate cyclase (GGDEF)-like protein/PAS domain S-box-containing protein